MITDIKPDHFFHRIINASRLLVDGRYSILINELKRQLDSESLSFGLQRDLKNNFEPPKAKINISIRHLKNEDIDSLLDNRTHNPAEDRAISDQRGIVDAGIPGCFVAVTDDNKPCYMQWLISSEHNDMVAGHFKGLFPTLNKPEALLEGAYTPPSFRGMGIMPAAMAQIAKEANGINATLVNTFVDINNIASLKGCRRAGFAPYVLRKDKWFMFRRAITFHPIPAPLLETYNRNTADKIS